MSSSRRWQSTAAIRLGIIVLLGTGHAFTLTPFGTAIGKHFVKNDEVPYSNAPVFLHLSMVSESRSSTSSARGPPPRRPARGRSTRGGDQHRFGGGSRGYHQSNFGPALKLENPLKIQRRKVQIDERREGRQSRPQQPQRRQTQGESAGQGRVLKNPQQLSRARFDAPSKNDVVKSSTPSPGSRTPGSRTEWNAGDDPVPGGDEKGRRRKDATKPGLSRAGPGGPKSKARRDFDKKRTPLRIGKQQGKTVRSRGNLKKRDRTQQKAEKEEKALERRMISLPDGPSLTVGQLADLLDEKPTVVIKYLMTDLGVMAAVSQTLDRETCVAVVEGFGRVIGEGEEGDAYDDEDEDDTALDLGFAVEDDDPEDLVPRAPVVTVMGHVDHGKTSLLDALRNTKVVAGESGGITQHIGAYQIKHEGLPITFIDTPGHAAFSDMRARGANVTDIVILVVAADDGVKQQTADSIACARQAGVPIVVAVNKCDLETADVNKVKTELTGYDLLTEDLGGEVLCSEVSAKQRSGLDDLLSKVMLQAELEDLRANPDRDAQGTVIEARVERGLGTVATTLIQRGTVKVGDAFVAGETSGRVRALITTDGTNKRVKEAGPSTPISIVGFGDGTPAAGDMLVVAEDEQTARELAASRQRISREKESSSYQSNLMDSVGSIFSGDARKEKREMCVVIKADVQGSAEALSRSLSSLRLENEEVIVTVKVLVADVGDVSKTDVAIASVTPGTNIIAFNTAATLAAMEDARNMDIPIGYYSVVYDAIDSVESRMQEVLSPTPEGEYVGSAVVQEVFNIGGTGNIAGSKCQDGFLKKGSNVRVLRGDKILTESKIKSLRNFKAEVDTINAGDECGIGLLEYEDFQPGDVIESYVQN